MSERKPSSPPRSSASASKASPKAGRGKRTQGANNATEVVQNRNRATYALADKSLGVARWSVAVGVLGILVGAAGWLTNPEPRYFAATADGRVIEMRALDDPLRTTNQISNWTANAITAAFTMDFVNFRDQLAAVEPTFTGPGYDRFLEALQQSGNLESVQQNRYVVSATLNGSPRIEREGVRAGRYIWRIRVPIIVGYESAENVVNQERDAVLTVVRVPSTEKPDGVAIHQIVMEQA